ncbi:hypothetical protein FACS189476_00190 [Spirochaetia bacterium]|nr:hypothetical protein FACS189476_00190 [Spirochaetia bacterium]
MNDYENLSPAGLAAFIAQQPGSAVLATAKKPASRHSFYTPQFSEMAAVSVRRLAWAMGEKVKMPAAVNLMVSLLPYLISPGSVCPHCQDKAKCQACIFSTPLSAGGEGGDHAE